ncbi:MAG: hypothetical protein IJ183_06635 [Prevotella sp.]|nr:hypothetical protein [Prevotella sp.]MBQ9560659.1 hypothetical protein [Prevotella sp.]MBR1839327.1 hypothetical protein [Prevotella sp.]
MKKSNDKMCLRNLTKGNVWELQESDIFAMWANADKEDDVAENSRRYMDIIRTAFDMEDVKVDKPEVIAKYEARGMRVGIILIKDKEQKWAIKKHPINRVTDLTYENIHHISAAKLLEVIDRNFGGGWDSLNQSIKDVILDGFDISTTTVPKDRLHKPGGLCEIKVNDGYEILEIEKGGWVEAIFAKAKPKAVKLHVTLGDAEPEPDENDDSDVEVKDDYYDNDEDDDIDDESLTEESYRTTIDEDPDELSLDAAEISDEDY